VVCSAVDIAGVDVVVQGMGRRGARCAQVGGLWSIETCEQMLNKLFEIRISFDIKKEYAYYTMSSMQNKKVF
jgi:hypothetical protein